VAASNANTTERPAATYTAPPRMGPSRFPMLYATLSVPLAHSSGSSPTRFGKAAPNEGEPARPTTDATNAILTSATGPRAVISASEHIAAPMFAAMISFWRSYRSASHPAMGVKIPVMPKLKKYQADSHTAEPVRSYKKKPNATAVAPEPSALTRLPLATR